MIYRGVSGNAITLLFINCFVAATSAPFARVATQGGSFVGFNNKQHMPSKVLWLALAALQVPSERGRATLSTIAGKNVPIRSTGASKNRIGRPRIAPSQACKSQDMMSHSSIKQQQTTEGETVTPRSISTVLRRNRKLMGVRRTGAQAMAAIASARRERQQSHLRAGVCNCRLKAHTSCAPFETLQMPIMKEASTRARVCFGRLKARMSSGESGVRPDQFNT